MTSSKPKILVLGVTGKVGNQTARLLAQKSAVQVVAGVRSPEKVQQKSDRGIEISSQWRSTSLATAFEGATVGAIGG